ncbi:hypothetical protein M979_1650 [Buttiauxella noackiae ATCC 51607]|uniref:YokE-like PH domain-containing protein n=1 Tax=Buttiauxella noackiae ATCC 51607 TaxID=1354255 RepID=A0A1B7HT55_9ENTR|nr:PH domain-containing protein [Buttiauxella noackiae]OAT18826.1 hypothetical protein M979_1650 [Buttiauxella noackiae ATCC 51607]
MKTNKHVDKFKNSHLQSGESIVSWGEGYIGKMMGKGKDTQHNGVLLVTDVRVTFYRKGFIGEVIESIPLKSITSIERKSTMGHRSLRIHTSHDDLEFKTFSKDTEISLINAIESGRNLKPEDSISMISQINSDPFEQLKKLAELKNAGVLSEEEFQSKKNKLMELI